MRKVPERGFIIPDNSHAKNLFDVDVSAIDFLSRIFFRDIFMYIFSLSFNLIMYGGYVFFDISLQNTFDITFFNEGESVIFILKIYN